MCSQSSKSCKSCHLSINDTKAYKLGTDQWHVDCFKCSKCSKSLGVNSNFLVLGTGALVCSDCSYTCKSCNKKIYDLAILTGDLAYCADCFICKSCHKPIDDLKYARTSKGLFCMPCHHMLMEKKKKYEKMKKLKEAREKSLNKAKESLNDRNLKSIITSEKLNNSTNIRSNVKDGHINNMDNIKEVPKITDLPKPEGLVSPDSKSDSSTQSYQGSIVSS